ncbi:YidC/Oxa1 family membrane protein insertase [Leucobacter sp. 1207-22]|uniref:YidC/Oxa1 family membrane protein insertase n=1 Tax=Leucobacter sp. 1207-22 TaxID=2604456 RepID=UPI0040627E4B
MNPYDFLPIRVLVEGAYWVVTTLSDLLVPLAGAESAAVAIVLLTLAVRAALIPVGRSQAKANAMRQRLAPELAALQRKYAKNPEVLQRKTMELYQREKASPLAGCLPLLIQMPILMAVYGLFVRPEIGGEDNRLLSHTFMGVPLDATLVNVVGGGSAYPTSIIVFVSVMALIGVVTWLSRRFVQLPATQVAVEGRPAPVASAAGMPQMPDLTGLTKALGYMPFVTVIIAGIAPLAAGLYLLVTTAWTFVERLVLSKTIGAPSVHETQR